MNKGMAADRTNPAIRSHSQFTATSAKMEPQQISLSELLDSRDRRRDMQLRLLQENPGKTLVVVTIGKCETQCRFGGHCQRRM